MTHNPFYISRQQLMREEYKARINRVIDYIDTHIDQELSLDTLAGVANFSRFHFFRIFQAITGETLNQFIQRVRVEKAAAQLIQNPKKSITEIAFDCGFSGSATFARAFKETYNMNASQWRSGGFIDYSNVCKTNSNNCKTSGKDGKECNASFNYINNESTTTNNWRNTMQNKTQNYLPVNVAVKDQPEWTVAYIRHIGPYKGDVNLFGNLFNKLFKWAEPRGLLRFPETKVLSIYHDDPNITDENKLRVSVGITVEKATPVDGEIGKMTLAAGKYAYGRFEIAGDQFQQAWDTLCGAWLPESGYQPADGPAFELCHNNCNEHPEHKFIVDLCIPVKPL